MTQIYEFPQQDKCKDEASVWVSRLDRDLSADERHELGEWLQRHPNNMTVLLNLARLWDRMDSLSRLGDIFEKPARRRPVRKWPLKAAVVAALAFVLAWGTLSNETPEILISKPAELPAPTSSRLFETAIGEQSTVSLTDGTQVVLNTNTRIRVQYTQQHRLIVLERGELQVRVAEDKTRPLSVVAGENIVQALGTVFNVEISDDQLVEVVVTEGRVLVGVHRKSADQVNEDEPVVLPLSSLTVAAGEELILGAEEEIVTEVSPVDIEVKLSWQSGNLVFRGESLEEAVAEISRYTSVEFVFLDDDLKKTRIVGLFKAGDVDGLLAALRENFDIAYRRSEDRIVLLSHN